MMVSTSFMAMINGVTGKKLHLSLHARNIGRLLSDESLRSLFFVEGLGRAFHGDERERVRDLERERKCNN